jgi:hypothetical protein
MKLEKIGYLVHPLTIKHNLIFIWKTVIDLWLIDLGQWYNCSGSIECLKEQLPKFLFAMKVKNYRKIPKAKVF